MLDLLLFEGIFEILFFWPLEALMQVPFAILWPRRSAYLRRQQWICGLLALFAFGIFGLGVAVAWIGRSLSIFAADFVVFYILATAAGILGHSIERRELEKRRRATARGCNKESTHV